MKQGTKHDAEKPRLDLISPEAMTRLAEVLTFGATKYDSHNWRTGFKWSRIIASAMRHLNAFNQGIDKDSETGYSHIAHAMCNLMFLLEFERTHKELDDRYKYVEAKGTKRSRTPKSRKPNAKGSSKASKKRTRRKRQASKKI